MPCYNPKFAVKLGPDPEGKYKLKFNYNQDDAARFPLVRIPCGQCNGCLLQRSRVWANRCMLEAKYHEENSFITITYDDQHVPRSFVVDPLTGEAHEHLTLRKRDWQLFMKRLRRRIEPAEIRFFACGEYGSKTFRPHYHAVIFGYSFPDKIYDPVRQNFRSSLLEDVWPFGRSSVGELTWESAAYTARYCMKKNGGANSRKDFVALNIEPEFVLMSRKPGIGRDWYDDHDVYASDRISVSTPTGGKSFPPPPYFDKLKAEEDPQFMEGLKAKRKARAEAQEQLELARTNLTPWDYYAMKGAEKSRRIKGLKRDKI